MCIAMREMQRIFRNDRQMADILQLSGFPATKSTVSMICCFTLSRSVQYKNHDLNHAAYSPVALEWRLQAHCLLPRQESHSTLEQATARIPTIVVNGKVARYSKLRTESFAQKQLHSQKGIGVADSQLCRGTHGRGDST